MPHSLIAAAIVALLCLAGSPGALIAASRGGAYVEKLASARAFTAEGSHALARAALAEALALAPDDTQRRWCRIWLLAAEHAENHGGTDERFRRELAELLQPYERDGKPRDEFWAEAKTIIPELGALLEVAQFWASQPVAPAANEGFAKAVRRLGARLVEHGGFSRNVATSPALEFLRRAADSPALPAADRARAALVRAQVLSAQHQHNKVADSIVTAAFAAALESARGTATEPETRVWHAAWTLRRGKFSHAFSPLDDATLAASPLSNAEITAMLELIDAALATAPATARDYRLEHAVKQLRETRVQLEKPVMQLDTRDAYAPGSQFSFDLTAQHVSEVELKLFKIDLDLFRELTSSAQPLDHLPAALNDETPIQIWTVKTGLEGPRGRVTSRHTWGEPLDPGAYVLMARENAKRSLKPHLRPFLVTHVQAFALQIGGDRMRVVAYEHDTGRLLTPVSGKLWADKIHLALQSDGDGRAAVSTTTLPHGATHSHVVGEAAGQPFIIRGVYALDEPADSRWRLHLLADRPLYQPGETAQWKLTARELVRGELRVPRGMPLTVRAFVGQDVQLGSWDVTLNPLGSAAGKLVLPSTIPPGQVRFEVHRTGTDDELGGIEAFLVDHFRAPEATLTIAPLDDAAFRRGRALGYVDLELTTRYFSGEPMANANVEATVNTRVNRLYPIMDYASEEFRGHAAPEELQLSATTDARGEARLRVPLPMNPPPHATMTTEARIATAGVSARASFVFDVLAHGYAAELAPATKTEPRMKLARRDFPLERPEPRVLGSPGQPTRLAFFARDGRDSGVAMKAGLTVLRQTWEEIWRTPEGALLSGEALREQKRRQPIWPPRVAGWERLHAGYRREKVATLEVATDATGRGEFEVPALPEGYYHVVHEPDTAPAQTKEPEPLARLELFLADMATTWIPFHAERATVVPAPSVTGKPIRALFILPEEGRRALASIGGVAGGESRLEAFGGNARLLEFAWQPGYWSGTKLGVAIVGGREDGSGFTEFLPSRAPHAARVAIQPEVAKSGPGEKTRLTIRTTDAAGQPIESEVALAVADAAVASLLPEKRQPAETRMLAPLYVHTSGARYSAQPANLGPVTAAASGGTLRSEVLTLSPFQVGEFRGTSMFGAAARMNLFDIAGAIGMPRVRGTFSYTAFWAPDLKTDARGEAQVEFSYPDNLTQWKITAEAIAADNRFGSGSATTQTTLPFQARLRMPRTVVAGDSIDLLGALVNTSADATTTRVDFTSATPAVLALAGSAPPRTLSVPARGETTVSARVRAISVGESLVRLTAAGDSPANGDAMELPLPVREDGFLQRTGGTARATERPATITLTLPAPLDPTRTSVTVDVSAGLIPALLEPLPYLIDYPYGCVEQTVSRFLPAAIVAKLLRDVKLDPAAIEQRVLAARGNDPHRPRTGAGLAQLDDVIAQSFARLIAAQNTNGSFGWFAHGEPDPYMTAYVLRALNIASAAGLPVPTHLHERTWDALLDLLDEKKAPGEDALRLAWALSAATSLPAALDGRAKEIITRRFTELYAVREELPASGIALLTRVGHVLGRSDELAVLRRNLENGVVRSRSAEFGETAQWGKTTNCFNGLEGAVETTALCLQALLDVEPQHALVDAAATWLLVNRQSGRWSNTRDSALAVLALHDYARARGNPTGSGRFRVAVNGHAIAERTFDRESLLAPASFTIDPKLLRAGRNKVTLTRLEGSTPCYLSATANSWAQAITAKPVGSFLRVERDYMRIVDQPTVLGTNLPRLERLPHNAGVVATNERVECRLIVHAQHDLDYVAIEVPKPGGCEPLNPLSGWDATLRRAADETDAPARAAHVSRHSNQLYREEHPDRSVFFLPRLPAGRWEIRYQMRAMFGGDYRALPATIEAMYVPVIQGNTDARRLRIQSGGGS